MLSHTNPSTVLLLTCLLQHNAAALSIANSHILLSPPPAHSLSETDTQPPSQNLLTYLSTTHTTPDTSTPNTFSSSLCTSFLSRDKTALLLPNARIQLSPAGFIDCFLEPQAQGSQAEDNQHQKQQLVFKGIPAGWQFSFTEITVAGWLDLERGSFVERVEVGVVYPEVEVKTMEESVSVKNTQGKKDGDQAWVEHGNCTNEGHSEEVESENEKDWKSGLKRELRKTRRATQGTQASKSQSHGLVDQATSLTPYGRFGTGYQGTFNLSMPVKPQPNPKASVFRSSSAQDKGRRDQLAVSPCSTGPEMEIALGAELWFSLSNEQIEFDDTIVHRGRLGGEDGDDIAPEEEDERQEGREGWERSEKTLKVGVTGEWKRC